MPMLIINEKEQKKPVFTVKTVTENGTYNAFEDNADGYSSFTVDTPVPTYAEKSITDNGIYNASDDSVNGYSKVTVNVQPDLITKSITANGTYQASSDNADGYSSVDVNVEGYKITDVSGLPSPIATFTDGAPLPMPKLEVSIEATQDLHGYDNPWPAGGGKNKFKTDFENTTINGTTITKTSDGRVLTSGVPTSPFDFVIGHVSLPAGSYILNGCPANGSSNKYRLQVTDYPVVNNLGLDYGSGVSFTLEHDMEIAVRIQIYTGASASLEFKPMIRLASVADATFAPYSNICPISGWDEANVGVVGVNQWDEEWEQGSYSGYGEKVTSSANRIRCKNPIPVKPNTTCYFEKYVYILCQFDKNGDFISFVQLGYDTMDNTSHTYAVGANTYYITWASVQQYGTTYNNDISINYPSTDTEYHAYNGSTITIQLGDTYYGGKLDVVSGVLTVEKGYIASYNGETLPSTWISDRDVYAEGTTPTIGAEVCYELATPSTIHLTPTAVKSLEGTNNLWANTGDVVEASYFESL